MNLLNICQQLIHAFKIIFMFYCINFFLNIEMYYFKTRNVKYLKKQKYQIIKQIV